MHSAPNSPPWSARWCWPQKHLPRPWNYYAYFRKVIDLRTKPQRAIVRVSADARYTLYVNAKRVHFGPARSYPEHQSYDTLDLTPYLTTGFNTLCAVCHQFGVPTFQSLYRGSSGFLLDGAIEVLGQTIPLHTPTDWLCQHARAWRRDVARLTMQLGFQEHFDADQHPADWMSPDFNASEDAGWKRPEDLGPVGAHPWLNMEDRGVPTLADHVEPFRSVVAQFTTENARGYKVVEDVYHLPAQENWKKEKSVLDNPTGMFQENDITTVNPRPDGTSPIAVLDLGHERTGHIILDIADANGDEIIDILYTEALDKNDAPQLIGCSRPTFCEEATADRYRCRPGPQRWECFHPKGFRYATLVFRNLTKPLILKHVAVRHIHAAVDEVGSFECSDDRLNKIWRVGRQTLLNCMLDAYIDCPWREQAQWWGDARVNFRVNAYTFGDVSLLERGIRQMARSQAADGSLHAHPPAIDVPQHRLPDFMLTWVGTLWDYHFHTSRTDLLRECLPTMHRLFEFFGAHEIKDGLIGGFDGFWVFLDWQPLHKSDFSGLLNLMYLQALRYAAAICYVLGDETRADEYNAKATTLAATVQQYFYDGKAKLWRDGFDPAANERTEAVSQHTNALAILLRLKPETHPTIAREVLLKPAQSRRTKIIPASPFFYAYVLEAMAEANYRAEVVQIIRDKWGDMLDRGATTFWEVWEPTIESRCHAWSASPVYHLSQQVLGVQPVDVGWKQIRIAPLPGKLEFARGVVPSPLGPVRVEWEQAAEDQLAVRVDLPTGMDAEFISPLGEIRSLEAGGHEFHT